MAMELSSLNIFRCRWLKWNKFLPFVVSLVLLHAVDAQNRHIRVRGRPIQQEPDENLEEEYVDEDNTQQPALQYYTSDSRNNNGRVVLVSSDDEYNGLYGKATTPSPRARVDYNRPVAKSSTVAPRLKDQGSKPPPVQTIRNYSKVNDDGSFTFGYEAADGSFKEETRGTDCVVRGKYGYVDPDGNKREFTYVSGNPCDPNHPDETEEEPERSEEDANEPENVPQNYPRRPVKPLAPRPSARPIQTTTHAPTTVFQNIYSNAAYQESDEEEQPEPIQLLQPQPQQFQRTRPAQAVRPEEVTIRQRPRITLANTTPTPIYNSPTKETHPVSITPRPTYRVSQQSLQTQPPATTYRPAVQFVTQKPASISYSPSSTPSHLSVEPITKSSYASSRKPIDFANEFQKFQQAHNVQSTTPRQPPQQQQVKVFKPSQADLPTSNPIYESQLVFDPSTGQYDSALYQQLPQSDGDFSLNHRIQPYVHQPEFNQPHPLISLEQLQQQNAQPLYHRPNPQPTRQQPFPQFSQQVYQKDHENTQVLSSQQLYAQQQELQQQQLRQDRLESAKQNQAHRFQLQPQPLRQEFQSHQQPQGYYFVAPQQSSGQIDAFLRGHNIDFN